MGFKVKGEEFAGLMVREYFDMIRPGIEGKNRAVVGEVYSLMFKISDREDLSFMSEHAFPRYQLAKTYLLGLANLLKREPESINNPEKLEKAFLHSLDREMSELDIILRGNPDYELFRQREEVNA